MLRLECEILENHQVLIYHEVKNIMVMTVALVRFLL